MNEHRSTITVYAGECMRAIDAIGGDPAMVQELVSFLRETLRIRDWCVAAGGAEGPLPQDVIDKFAEMSLPVNQAGYALLARIQPKENGNG